MEIREVMPMGRREENEQKKEYLMGYQRASRQLARLQEELYELRMNKIAPSATHDGMPHSVGGSDLSAYAAKVDELEKKIMKARYRKIQKFKQIRDRIEGMSNENEKDVLVYRYIRGMKWEDIAVKMGYTWQHVHKIHSRALKNFKRCD